MWLQSILQQHVKISVTLAHYIRSATSFKSYKSNWRGFEEVYRSLLQSYNLVVFESSVCVFIHMRLSDK